MGQIVQIPVQVIAGAAFIGLLVLAIFIFGKYAADFLFWLFDRFSYILLFP